jgi:cytochrome P450
VSNPLSRCSFLRAAAVVAIGAAAVPVGWVTLTTEHLVHAEKLSPPAGSRLIAYTTIALYEAVSAAEPGAESLAGGLTGTPAMPAVDPALHLDADVTAAAAARGVVTGLLGPDAAADTRAAIDALYTDQRDQAAAGTAEDVLQASAAHGERVAAAILDWAESDGSTGRSAPYELPSGPGLWELAPPAPAPVEPQ